MQPLYVHTVFDDKNFKPRCTGLLIDGKMIFVDLYQGIVGNPILPIMENVEKIQKIIQKAEAIRPVVITEFLKNIKAFKLYFADREADVYDPHLPKLPPSNTPERDRVIITKVLAKLSKTPILPYQKIFANAQIVYNDLNERGLYINHILFQPQWSVDTFTGRSKSINPNIQGWPEHSIIRPKGYSEKDVLIHFDWICADIRVASILSGDPVLEESFVKSDPYDHMTSIINEESETKITRQESKHLLLKSINSMDITSLVFTDIYVDLGRWINRCRKTIENGDYVSTILNKKFKLNPNRNSFAILNGVMQGSVAHAMQRVIRKTWEAFPTKIVAEIHDSMVVASSSNSTELMATIDIIANIMAKPFEGIIDENPFFPLKVSISRKWKKWEPLYVIRESGKQKIYINRAEVD
jgi:hypothetical protein